jgi:hypothetical protein
MMARFLHVVGGVENKNGNAEDNQAFWLCQSNDPISNQLHATFHAVGDQTSFMQHFIQ